MNHHHYLLRAVALVASLFLLAACGSKSDRIQSGLQKGAAYVQAADWDKANVEMRNVLQIDPKNPRAFFISAQAAEGKRDIQRAYGSYLKAIELDPNNVDAKVGLARVYMVAGDIGMAEKTIEKALTAAPDHLGARTLRAALMARRDDLPGAVALAKSLVEGQKSPPIESSLVLAGLYRAQGDSRQALGTVEAALNAEPKNVSLLLVAAQLTGESDAPEVQARAVDFYRRLTEAAPKNDDLWNAWAVHHMRRNELDPAEAVLRAAVKGEPDDSARVLSLLDFLTARRSHDIAEKEFAVRINAKPKDMNLRFGLVNLYRLDNRAADVRRGLQEIVATAKETAPGLIARTQLAADALADGKTAAASALVAEVLKANPRDGAALVLRGRMLLADDDPRGAVIDLRAAAKDQPGSAEVAGLLARAHRQSGEPQLAREALTDAVKFKPESPELRLLLAADMADAKEYLAAVAEVDAAMKVAPQNSLVYDTKVQLALAQKDVAGAERTMQALKAQLPNDPIGAIKLGEFYSGQRRYDAALKEYDAAGRLAPGAPGPFLAGIGVLIAQRRFDEAGTRIAALMQREPKNVLPYQLTAELAVARNDAVAAEQAFRKMIEFAPEVAAGYRGLSALKQRQNKATDALSVLEAGEKANPADLSLPVSRAALLADIGRRDEAIALYESLLKRAPDDDAYANNLAYLLTEAKGDSVSLDRALNLALRFKHSSNANYLDSLGWVHYKRREYAEAVVVLERVVRSEPQNPLFQLHLGLALFKKGDVARGTEFLTKALASKPGLPYADEARSLVAQR